MLSDVLDDLVTKGTITATQKTAILDAVKAERTVRREARQEARKAAREQAKANRQQLKGFLADGVITQEEFDKLPADSRLRKVTGLMDDGKITTDELKALGRGFMERQGPRPRLVREGQDPGRLAGADGRHQRLTRPPPRRFRTGPPATAGLRAFAWPAPTRPLRFGCGRRRDLTRPALVPHHPQPDEPHHRLLADVHAWAAPSFGGRAPSFSALTFSE